MWSLSFCYMSSICAHSKRSAPRNPPSAVTPSWYVQAEHMHDYARRCSRIARVFSIGKSAEGRELWALEIAAAPGLEQAKPRAKYVANMHGDEPTGRCSVSIILFCSLTYTRSTGPCQGS